MALPHDYRDFGGPTSLTVLKEAISQLRCNFPEATLDLIEDRKLVSDMVPLVRNAVATVSGYMHFALISSFNLTPSFFLIYHDKGVGQAKVNPLLSVGNLTELEAFVDTIARLPFHKRVEQQVRLTLQRRRARRQLFGGRLSPRLWHAGRNGIG